MIKILKEFFDKGKVKLGNLEDYWESDLHKYMKHQYGEMIFVRGENNCFISVQLDENNNFWLVEKVFYEELVGDEVGCFIPSALSDLVNWDCNWRSRKGKKLSKEGYFITDLTDTEQELISQMSRFRYSGHNLDTTAHYRYSDKYSEFDINNLTKDSKLEFSIFKHIFCGVTRGKGILSSLDFFNANFLRYPDGTKIAPHTDVDMCSFANIVFYKQCQRWNKKQTVIGTWDWYDKVMDAIDKDTLHDVDMPHDEPSRIPIHKHNCSDKTAIVFNFFNPKFYHQVPATKGRCYTGLFFGSFSDIMKKKDIEW